MIWLLVLAEPIIVLAVALVTFGIVAHSARNRIEVGSRLSWAGVVAAAAAVVAVVVFYATQYTTTPDDPAPWRFAIPLLGGVVGALALLIAGERMRRASDAAPARAWTPGRRALPAAAAAAALALALIATVVVAGLVAGPDTAGRPAAFVLEIAETSVSTAFPGWFYGIPVLVALLVLAAITVVGVARSPAAASARALLSVSAGMTAFTLGALWLFIARAGGLGATVVGPRGDLVELTSPLAPLQIPLNAAGLLLCGVGVGLAAVAAVIRVPIAAQWRRMGRTNEE